MDILIKAGQLVLSLSILIILHEFGHFAFARLFKTRVEKFYLFFDAGFSLFKFKKGETEYGIGWLPLGGYVKISGMMDESMDTEQLKQPVKPYEFRAKKTWQRLLIMLGGVLVNLVLAILIFVFILNIWGYSYIPNNTIEHGIYADSSMLATGFKTGDKILKFNNKEVTNFSDIKKEMLLYKDITKVTVLRNGQEVNIDITDDDRAIWLNNMQPVSPRFPFVTAALVDTMGAAQAGVQEGDEIVGINDSLMPFFDQYPNYLMQYKNDTVNLLINRAGNNLTLPVKVSHKGKLGIGPEFYTTFYPLHTVDYNFFEAIPAGIQMGFKNLREYIMQFPLIFNKKTKAYKDIGGFIRIGSIFPSVWDWQAFWHLTAILSIMLAFLNVLPIPALDGGHVMFLLYEMVTGRKPGDKFLEYAQYVGIFLLLGLLLYANGNDVYHFIIKKFIN